VSFLIELCSGDRYSRLLSHHTSRSSRVCTLYLCVRATAHILAVRVGDMTAFQKTLTTHDATFTADDNHLLILRLRHFVLKTALRTITLAYSRISIRDICVKLKTDSEEETEYIVAKAIRDGVIEATIDHTGAFMQSRVARNVYETDEPQQQLTRRTTYLQNMYSETVRVSLNRLRLHGLD
jgi:26S proteasome regulatory subunit N3